MPVFLTKHKAVKGSIGVWTGSKEDKGKKETQDPFSSLCYCTDAGHIDLQISDHLPPAGAHLHEAPGILPAVTWELLQTVSQFHPQHRLTELSAFDYVPGKHHMYELSL